MLDRIRQSPGILIWAMLGASLGCWWYVASQTSLPYLELSTPFMQLGFSFWLGLFLGILSFFLGQKKQRVFALILLAWYFIATLSFIYPYAVMHDSLNNVLVFPKGEDVKNFYGISYIGFGSFISLLQNATGADPQFIARYFPVGMTIAYLLVLGLFTATWREQLFTNSRSILLCLLFFFVFGDAFYLRINASPQTLGYLLFLIALAIIPLSSRSIGFKVLLIITLAMMIVMHPITPLLALPGLCVAAYIGNREKPRPIRYALEFTGSMIVGYAAWTLYQADWIISQAANIVAVAFQAEKRLPIVDSPVIPQVESYILLHRIFLVALLLLLVVSYLRIWRSRTWWIITIWGLSFLPGFLLLFSYRDFFDRILLFLLIPCAVLFGEAGNCWIEKLTSLRKFALLIFALLAMLAASVAYFGIGAIDRVSQDEMAAYQYLASLDRPITIYADGFNLPISEKFKFLPATRGILRLMDIEKAEVVVFSNQLQNAVLFAPVADLRMEEFTVYLQDNFHEVYSNRGTRVFLRESSETP